MRESPVPALLLSHHGPLVSCEAFWALFYHLCVGGWNSRTIRQAKGSSWVPICLIYPTGLVTLRGQRSQTPNSKIQITVNSFLYSPNSLLSYRLCKTFYLEYSFFGSSHSWLHLIAQVLAQMSPLPGDPC